ncbi:hypothetical protein BKA66DRAFT_410383, partial [Pyrenochaeta sp. MPI-SDFR-AT-0127]
DTRDIGRLERQLFSQLIQYRGCCDDCHVKSQCEHSERKMRHFGLKEYLNEIKTAVDYPDVPGSETLASREAKLAGHVDEDSKRHIYCGIRGQGPDPEPAHICLDAEARETMVATTSFDIDSVIGFGTSLAMAKRVIHWNPTQMPVSDLQSDLHLNHRQVHYLDRHGHSHTVRKPVHHLPHYMLGRLVGFEDISLYLFFSRLYREDQQSSRLLDSDFRTWMDHILLPIIYRHHESSLVQHYPSSHDHSLSNSTAQGVEMRSQRIDTIAREQRLSHFLPPAFEQGPCSRP